jgi:hypothetical protein
MRLIEFASAEEQIALFKLITDKVWQSLADQKRQADEQAALRRRTQAVKGSVRAKRAATPKPTAAIKPQPIPKTQPTTLPSASYQATHPTVSLASPTSSQKEQDDDSALGDARIALYPQKSAISRISVR